MDPNQLKTLDPKLREAYERVMTASNQAASQPTPTPSQPTEQPPSEQPTSQPGHDPLDAMSHASSRFIPDSQAAPTAEAPAMTPPPLPVAPPPPPPVVVAPPPPAPVVQPASQAVANDQVHAYVAEEVAGVKKSLQFIQIMYVVGGAVFFVVYALFWMKFFNVASPF